MDVISRQSLELKLLNQISRTLTRYTEVERILQEVLDILDREMGLLRGTITLRSGDELVIAASHGMSRAERERGRYRLGEGVTGDVAQTGRSRIIPDIACDPNFLNRTRTRIGESDIAFLCAPVVQGNEVIGTMSIDRKVDAEVDLESDLSLLETVANILAEAIAGCRAKFAEREHLLSENRRLLNELEKVQQPGNIVGSCELMREVYRMIAQVASSNATVLIRGSSGTGKELVARAIRHGSTRRDAAWVVVNCAALPENLVESELFGHEKGAFTGAVGRRVGRLEAAHKGTLFLDEIGDLSLPMQVKLLRFLQERTYQRVGSNEELQVDVRLLAATSRDLEALMREGLFREDLYYRLNVFPIHLPDLADRKMDIAPLAEFFLVKYNHLHGKNVKRITSNAMNAMLAYSWPGNVRELENIVERGVLTAYDDAIHTRNLPPDMRSPASATNLWGGANADAGLQELTDNFERGVIIDALTLCSGNVTSAARHLKTTPRIVRYKAEQLGVDPKDFRR